ncbi:MAG: hypothetical protein JNN18_19560 [Rubrivivax sp.]|nr:hypothetical protein [Rubrivivax sp.]
MATALSSVAWEASVLEPRPDRALEAQARRRFGVPLPSVRYFVAVPWVARAAIDLHVEFGLLLKLDQRTADLVALVVSQENSCRYCYAAVRTTLWYQGMDTARIERIERDLAHDAMHARTRATLDYARRQSRLGPAAARAARDGLRQHGVEADEFREIAFTVALTDFSNRLHTAAAVPALPLEGMPERAPYRWVRPLIDWIMRRHHARGHPVPAPVVDAHQPYARLVQAYAGSPIGAALARTLDEMWASPQLTRRCKLLIFAVVSRGLPCEICETEVGHALQREGLDAGTLARALRDLDAPELDAVERALLPFARETLWYEPAALQRRTRALLGALTAPQIVEAIAVAALANGLCRMTALVLEDA